ncbi:hypothetical protein RB195_017567 [Necator americanus]|uniref:Uncharacterized protein n=1 Tax=Necator americanus TaxID=51031 RepID=A0ABR1C5T9_NECAM
MVLVFFVSISSTFGEDVADSYATTEDYEDGFIITENYTEDVNQNVTDSSGRPVETTHTFDYEDDNQAEGLVATDNCLMATLESRHKTASVDLQIFFYSVENGRVFDSVGYPDQGLSLKSVSILCLKSMFIKPALDSSDGSGGLAQSAVDVAGRYRCSDAATPFIEDDSSKLLFCN